jgi:hypothetical protein
VRCTGVALVTGCAGEKGLTLASTVTEPRYPNAQLKGTVMLSMKGFTLAGGRLTLSRAFVIAVSCTVESEQVTDEQKEPHVRLPLHLPHSLI